MNCVVVRGSIHPVTSNPPEDVFVARLPVAKRTSKGSPPTQVRGGRVANIRNIFFFFVVCTPAPGRGEGGHAAARNLAMTFVGLTPSHRVNMDPHDASAICAHSKRSLREQRN